MWGIGTLKQKEVKIWTSKTDIPEVPVYFLKTADGRFGICLISRINMFGMI